jgi:uncharacterized membrane protein/predicted DsbA family dithiol-disulfide isomerase
MAPKSTRLPAGLALSLVPVLAGLAVSAALLVDYVRPRPVFCAVGGGCDAVKHTAFAAVLGVPTPAVGVVGFLAIGVAALVDGRRARVMQLVLSVGAALVGALLLSVQIGIHVLCPYCTVADACAIVSAVIAAVRLRPGACGASPRWSSYAATGLMSLAVAAPVGAGLRATPVPSLVRDEMSRTPKGQIAVVDFVDFECPFCRMTHEALEPLLEAHAERVRRVRFQVPLRSHPHALDAARAARCGEKLGMGTAMANALFTAPVEELSPDGCERLALHLGLPIDAFRACVNDPATLERIESDRAKFRQAGGYALPTIWVDKTELIGAQSETTLRQVLQKALGR